MRWSRDLLQIRRGDVQLEVCNGPHATSAPSSGTTRSGGELDCLLHYPLLLEGEVVEEDAHAALADASLVDVPGPWRREGLRQR